jgi:outer membrane receptor for ferrienterochelin and colicins
MKARTLTVLVVFASLALPGRARADDDDLDALLNEKVVTGASSVAETTRDAPATSTVITGDELRTYGARTLAEAIDMLSLGAMTAQASDSGEIGARGVLIAHSGGQHFLLLINGQRANDILFGSAIVSRASGIPLEIVDHVEIILGPGSVLYGSNAMLGVINVVTKPAKDFSGARVGIESDLFTSVRPWAGGGTPFKLFGVEGEATGEVEYFRQWGPRLSYDPVYGGLDPTTGQPIRYTSGPQGTGVWGGTESDAQQRIEAGSMLGRVSLGKFALSLGLASNRAPVGSAGGDFDSDTHSRTGVVRANLAYEDLWTPALRMKAHAYVNLQDSTSTLYYSRAPDCALAAGTCQIDVLGESATRGLEVTPSIDWFRNGKFVTTLGAEGVSRGARTILNTYDASNLRPVADSTGMFNRDDMAFAAYAQQTWNPVRWFGLNVGGRLDYDPRFAPVSSPRVAIRVDPWHGGTLKLIYSEAFRAPSFFESYFGHPLSPAADSLRPERERSLEASIEQRFAAQRLLFGAFATNWTDLIQYYQFSAEESAAWVAEGKSTIPPSYQYRNINSVNNWGVNAAFSGSQLSRALEYGVNVTAAIARITDDQEAPDPLTVSPSLFGNAHVAYHLPGLLPTLALAVSGQGRRPVEDAFSSSFTSYLYSPVQVVVRGTVTGPVPHAPGLSYRLTAFYSSTDREPFLAGPVVSPSAQYRSPALVPIDRARVTVGLQYEF